jgi:hypothetical protein
MTTIWSRRLRAGAVLAAAVAAAGLMVAGTAPAALAAGGAISPWGPAQRVPGSVALNSGGPAAVNSVSCPATGGCVAGGFFTDAAGGDQPFLVTQSGGVWGSAILVPGIAALNATDLAHVSATSCGAAGNCAASGSYQDASGHQQAYVVNETNGTWGTAIEVPGTAALNAGGFASATYLSCPTAGNCAAGGVYTDAAGKQQAFVVNETGGTWGTAIEVPGTAALNAFGRATVTAVSCPKSSPRSCAAVGTYGDTTGHVQSFLVSETSGTWGTAIQVPGVTQANVTTVSCTAAGSCVAAGSAGATVATRAAFTITESGGTWGIAEVPGVAALDTGNDPTVRSVFCPSTGNCAMTGTYATGTSLQPFVATETGGTWGTAIQVPGVAGADGGRNADIGAVSCSSAGNCTTAGGYDNGSGKRFGYVVTLAGGTWGGFQRLPNTEALGNGDDTIGPVSCAASGYCAAGGSYASSTGTQQALVAATDGTWGSPAELTGIPSLGGQDPSVAALACSSAGNCTAVGSYKDSSGFPQMFAVTETNGFWATAVRIGAFSRIVLTPDVPMVLSCVSAGNCTAGFSANDAGGNTQAFVVSQVNGAWGTPQLVPGVSALNTNGEASVTGLSCKSAGNCTAGGFYFVSFFRSEAYVVTETNGTWGTAIQVPGTASLNIGAGRVTSVACTAAGNCSAVGNYQAVLEVNQPFVINQRNGTWGTAQPVSISAIGGTAAEMNAVSCGANGNCGAVGTYFDSGNLGHGFTVNETGSTWRAAQRVAEPSGTGLGSQATLVACPSAGNCAAGGLFFDSSGQSHAYVVNEAGGTWGSGQQVPGLDAMTGSSNISQSHSIACSSAGNCVLGGDYQDSRFFLQAFVVNETGGTWRVAQAVPGITAINTSIAQTEAVSCVPGGRCTAAGIYSGQGGSFHAWVDSQLGG